MDQLGAGLLGAVHEWHAARRERRLARCADALDADVLSEAAERIDRLRAGAEVRGQIAGLVAIAGWYRARLVVAAWPFQQRLDPLGHLALVLPVMAASLLWPRASFTRPLGPGGSLIHAGVLALTVMLMVTVARAVVTAVAERSGRWSAKESHRPNVGRSTALALVAGAVIGCCGVVVGAAVEVWTTIRTGARPTGCVSPAAIALAAASVARVAWRDTVRPALRNNSEGDPECGDPEPDPVPGRRNSPVLIEVGAAMAGWGVAASLVLQLTEAAPESAQRAPSYLIVLSAALVELVLIHQWGRAGAVGRLSEPIKVGALVTVATALMVRLVDRPGDIFANRYETLFTMLLIGSGPAVYRLARTGSHWAPPARHQWPAAEYRGVGGACLALGPALVLQAISVAPDGGAYCLAISAVGFGTGLMGIGIGGDPLGPVLMLSRRLVGARSPRRVGT